MKTKIDNLEIELTVEEFMQLLKAKAHAKQEKEKKDKRLEKATAYAQKIIERRNKLRRQRREQTIKDGRAHWTQARKKAQSERMKKWHKKQKRR